MDFNVLSTTQGHLRTSNSGHKQIHISKLFSHIYISTLCQVSLQNQSLRKHKAYINNHQTKNIEELVPSILPLLKEHIRLGHGGIIDHSVGFINTTLKKNMKKELTKKKKKYLNA